jgi:hypothetical protein
VADAADRHRLGNPLQRQRLECVEPSAAAAATCGLAVAEDAAGGRHQSAGEVDRRPDHGVEAPVAGRDVTGVDEPRGDADAPTKSSRAERVLCLHGGHRRPCRVVLVAPVGEPERDQKGEALVVRLQAQE